MVYASVLWRALRQASYPRAPAIGNLAQGRARLNGLLGARHGAV